MPNKRIYAQYADKPKAVQWFNITPDIADEFETVYEMVRNSYDIDANSGEQLNVIGRIVDIDRSFEADVFYTADTRFGAGNKASRFGGVSARFNNNGKTISDEVSDAIFRVLIKAKIAKNNSDATLDGIVHALSYITNSSPIQVIDGEDMTFSVVFGTVLNDIERFVFSTFDVVPKPQGVKFTGYTEIKSLTRFGGPYRFGDNISRFNNLYFGV
tara:strand:+ start:2327 stop:2968 length:642 start_codon:yes stop_codon:yes gene_type:complete